MRLARVLPLIFALFVLVFIVAIFKLGNSPPSVVHVPPNRMAKSQFSSVIAGDCVDAPELNYLTVGSSFALRYFSLISRCLSRPCLLLQMIVLFFPHVKYAAVQE
jgi:hypothetical protein